MTKRRVAFQFNEQSLTTKEELEEAGYLVDGAIVTSSGINYPVSEHRIYSTAEIEELKAENESLFLRANDVAAENHRLAGDAERLTLVDTIINSLKPHEGFILKRVGGRTWEWQASRTCPNAADWHIAEGCRCRYFNDTTPDGAIRGLAAALDGREGE